jgi:uncharacterized LabA/DUF88 family protein
MAEYVYVDNSNVFIEGQRVSAVENGLALSIWDAMSNRIIDVSYRIAFGKLLTFVAGDRPENIRRAALFGSRPPKNDSLWKIAERAGFETVIIDRNVANREKKIDTGIVTAMVADAYKRVQKNEDTMTLVAGDGDFVPAIEQLREDDYRVEVVFWEHASIELKKACNKFTSLNPYLRLLAA